MARVAPRRGRRVVPEGGVDEARAGIPVGRRSVPGGVGAVPGLPPQACGGVRRRQPRRLVQGLPRDDRHAAEPPVRDAAGLRRGRGRPRARGGALHVRELRPRGPVDELRPAGLPPPARDLDGDLSLRPRGACVGDRRLDPRPARRTPETLASALDVIGAPPRQGTFATAIPHGSVPHGTRATTVSERVSITATSFVRPTVAQRNRPSGVSAVHQVRGPTGIALSTFSDAVSRTRISPDWPCDTYARAPSGANVTSTGRLPPVGADLVRASCATSITDTTCACSLATKRRRESAVKRIPRGFRGTAISLTTVSVAVSIRWTSSEVSLETATQRPSGDATAVSGSFPTAIFFVIFSDSASRTVTESSFSLTT